MPTSCSVVFAAVDTGSCGCVLEGSCFLLRLQESCYFQTALMGPVLARLWEIFVPLNRRGEVALPLPAARLAQPKPHLRAPAWLLPLSLHLSGCPSSSAPAPGTLMLGRARGAAAPPALGNFKPAAEAESAGGCWQCHDPKEGKLGKVGFSDRAGFMSLKAAI